MPVDTIASRKDGRPDAGDRPGHDASRDRANCLRLRGTESGALAGSIEALPKATPLGLCMKGVVTAGFWVKSGNLSLWPMLCCRRVGDQQTAPAESIANAWTGLGTWSH